TERRAVLGSSKRKLVQVAAAMAATAAGMSAEFAPASTSQRQRNHVAREAVCNTMRLQLTLEALMRANGRFGDCVVSPAWPAGATSFRSARDLTTHRVFWAPLPQCPCATLGGIG